MVMGEGERVKRAEGRGKEEGRVGQQRLGSILNGLFLGDYDILNNYGGKVYKLQMEYQLLLSARAWYCDPTITLLTIFTGPHR